jgi:hypothetical protein
MRYKALSPFVRNSRPAETPPPAQRSSAPRALLLVALSGVLVLTPVAFIYAEGTIVVPIAAEADAADGGRQSPGGRPSEPPGQAKRSATPTPAPASASPTATAPPASASATASPTSPPASASASPVAPPPPPSGRCSVSPGAAPSGWRRVMSDSFGEDIPLGQWGKPGGTWERPGGMWRGRTAGWKDSSGRGTYDSPRTTSQHDGMLDVWIHSEGSVRYVAAPIPLVGNTAGQRISLCVKADEIPGYKVAFLLWPNEGPGNYHGEINFPEGRLLTTATANAFMHYDPKPTSGKTQDWFDGGVALQGWHAFTIEWHPSRDYVSFFRDGTLIGRSNRPEVPNGPMHYVMQMETYLSGQPLPPPAEGHVRVDWFTIDVPA